MAQAPFVITPALTAVVVDYAKTNSGRRRYIADQVLPRVPVDTPTFRYPTYPIEEAFTVVDDTVGRTSRPNQLTLTALEVEGSVIDHAIDAPVPFRDEKAAQGQLPMSVRARHAMQATNTVQMNREIRAASLYMSAGNYQTGYKATLSGTGQWSHASSDPVTAVQDAAEGMLVRPNVAITSQAVVNALSRHDAVSRAIGGDNSKGKHAQLDELAAIFGLSRIIVGGAIKQTSKKGQSLTTSNIWGNHFAMAYIPELGEDGMIDPGDTDAPAFAKTFQWGQKVGGTINDPNMGMYGGVNVRSGESVVEKIISQYAGYLFSDAIA